MCYVLYELLNIKNGKYIFQVLENIKKKIN